jgi:hypothetical protein
LITLSEFVSSLSDGFFHGLLLLQLGVNSLTNSGVMGNPSEFDVLRGEHSIEDFALVIFEALSSRENGGLMESRPRRRRRRNRMRKRKGR